MATIDWPTWLQPSECSPELVKNALVFRSPMDKSVSILRQPGEYWAMSLTLPRCRLKTDRAAARRAFINSLTAGSNRVRAWHFEQPTPRGTLRGVPTLFGAAARGDSSLYIIGALTGDNLILGSGLEFDSNADGICDYMTQYSNGSPGTVTPSKLAGASGGQQIQVAAGAATTDTDRAGFMTASVPVAGMEGRTVSFAAQVAATGVAASLTVGILWYGSGGAYITLARETVSAPASLGRVGRTATVPAGAETMRGVVFLSALSSAGTATMTADNLQLQFGANLSTWSGKATVLAGDLIGAGGQLFEVAADKTLNDAGAGFIALNNRVRAPISIGTAVLWDKPTAQFIVAAASAPISHTPGWQEPIVLDLQEVWDA